MTMLSHFAASGGAIPVYIEDVFSTWRYNGNSSTQTINNGIDLAGKGGLVWVKSRSNVSAHSWFDTARGANKALWSEQTAAQYTYTDALTSFNANGFTLGASGDQNLSGATWASWTFREQPKFFDVVTYTGNGTSSNAVSHALASQPAFIITKRTDSTGNWIVWHRTGTSWVIGYLNTTGSMPSAGSINASVTSTQVNIGAINAAIGENANISGASYVMYLFAHNAGGFGLTGTDNVISCGSYTGNSSLNSINLGFEAQWVLIKNATTGGTNWIVYDNMRGWADSGSNQQELQPNTTGTEVGGTVTYATSTGFAINDANSRINASGNTYIYIAIRRGLMKTPTSGTSVFAPVAYTGNSSTQNISTGVNNNGAGGLVITKTRFVNGLPNEWTDSLRGTRGLFSTNTNLEGTNSDMKGLLNNGFSLGFNTGYGNQSTRQFIGYQFIRAPGFFDVVCYTGTGTARTVSHNLGAAPELMIVKRRGSSTFGEWVTFHSSLGADYYLLLNGTQAVNAGPASSIWNSTLPNATTFSVGNYLSQSDNYVAYLFASCPGVSKVGNYTGNGSTQTLDCGFAGGARFVLIKRTDSSGDWYVWDSARGIVSGNDPYFALNSTLGEDFDGVRDTIDPVSSGFVVNNDDRNFNVNGGTYIFLAIA